MLDNMKIGSRLLLGFLALAILTALVGVVGIKNMSAINDKASELYQRELLGLSYIKEANIDLIYVGRAMSNALLASSQKERKEFLTLMEKARKELKANADMARPLFYTDAGKRLMADFDKKYAEYDALVSGFAGKITQDGLHEPHPLAPYFFGELSRKGDAVDDLITDLSKVKERNGAEADRLTTELYESSRLYMLILVISSACAGLLLGMVLTRSITRPIAHAVRIAQTVADGDLTSNIEVKSRDETGALLQALQKMNQGLIGIVSEVRGGTEVISSASSQIATGNLDLSSRTEQQASSLEETASSMEQLTATVKQNADNAVQAKQLAQSASVVAAQGGAAVAKVVDTMSAITESSREIVDIIGVIDGIAFQTNILALNAAVEAARAGEQGRGFAVVAGEVRTLAQRAAAAAKEIKVLIDTSVEKVDAGSKLVESAGATMLNIVDSVKRVADIISEITAASAEQTNGIEQINEAVSQMDQVTQQNAALVEEAAAASQSLQDQAAKLNQVVAVFKLSYTPPTSPATLAYTQI
ncbi:MCP four helix bundle domain-containing protein [Herbaspirillum sp. LeCh32-8]|uniref:methyl-accepting chemotaxis protein n=1 Tax=Herbaspirillum sp. LeCh32-8 TaxID=2821356 RepID=UPI001AE18BBF|nr:methyl-accepting chemotaxis protein [Herbaspirillum sp. LeCh32-8]MBP0599689.1 MCP four helix bundle domain-containing protein [Herbaspirillum sp. LeCh32-8]